MGKWLEFEFIWVVALIIAATYCISDVRLLALSLSFVANVFVLSRSMAKINKNDKKYTSFMTRELYIWLLVNLIVLPNCIRGGLSQIFYVPCYAVNYAAIAFGRAMVKRKNLIVSWRV